MPDAGGMCWPLGLSAVPTAAGPAFIGAGKKCTSIQRSADSGRFLVLQLLPLTTLPPTLPQGGQCPIVLPAHALLSCHPYLAACPCSFKGLFWKFARIGERLSPWVSVACIFMAFTVIFF